MKDKNKWAILFTVVIMTFMATLDSSIVNVALPVMNKELGTTMSTIEWIVTSYLITVCAIILPFGRIGDTKGKTKVFKIGIVIFTVGSLMCGLAKDINFLIFARIVQAIGAAGTMATNQGIITESFPPSERGRALGMIGTFVALGTMVGPSLGGIIVSALKWNYIFLINIPIGLITFFVSLKTLPKEAEKDSTTLDYKGTILFTLFVVLLFGSIILGQQYSYTNTYIVMALLISIVLFVFFVKFEIKHEYPLVDVNMFRNKLFTVSIICGFTSFIAISGTNIILPFYLQDAMKLSPGVTGLLMTVSPIVLGILAPISGYLSDKFESEKITFMGLTVMTIGLLLMSTLKVDSPIWVVALFLAITSAGSAMFQSPNNSLIMSTVSKDKLGIAGSINSLIRNLGMISGIALSTTLLYSRMSAKIGYKVLGYVDGRPDVFIYGMKVVYIVVTIICLIGTILTLMRLINKSKPENNDKCKQSLCK